MGVISLVLHAQQPAAACLSNCLPLSTYGVVSCDFCDDRPQFDTFLCMQQSLQLTKGLRSRVLARKRAIRVTLAR